VIASIDFRNFKVLRDARIELGPFNLIIGCNGSGKTSVFTALQTLRHLAVRPVVFDNVVTPASPGSLRFRFRAPFEELEVCIACGADGTGQTLAVVGGTEARHRWPEIVARLATLRTISLDATALARPSPPGAPIQLADDGSGLPAALDRLQREAPGTFAQIAGEFCRVLPEYRAVGVETDADGTRRLWAEVVGENRRLPAADLSQGTLVMLGLLVLVSTEPVPAVLGLEEIDRGIHPRLLREIRDVLYRLSFPEGGRPATQVLTTSHSPYLLDLFRDQLDEVIIAQKHGAEATFERLSERADLREAIGGASLGDLWYSGILGGVPDER